MKVRKIDGDVRVQIPAYTDWWMRGARYGRLVKVTEYNKLGVGHDIAHVKLDATGKVRKFVLMDCTFL